MMESTSGAGISRVFFCLLVLLNCWLWMQGIHEIGHVLAAVVSQGHVQCVVWHPLTVSRTDVAPNPHPLLVCWMGPVAGCVLPLLCAKVAGKMRMGKWNPELAVLWFFCGFCCVANGAYIAIGSFDRVGDAGVLLRHGSPDWLVWTVGAVAIIAGLLIWHRLGNLFAVCRLTVTRRALNFQAALLLLTLLLQAAVFCGCGRTV